jgi:stress response protein YsnF
MKIGSYITSGILQDYCLGLLSIEEEKKVEIMCAKYPIVLNELNLLRQSLEKYSESESTFRREELRMNIWKAVKKLWEEEL